MNPSEIHPTRRRPSRLANNGEILVVSRNGPIYRLETRE